MLSSRPCVAPHNRAARLDWSRAAQTPDRIAEYTRQAEAIFERLKQRDAVRADCLCLFEPSLGEAEERKVGRVQSDRPQVSEILEQAQGLLGQLNCAIAVTLLHRVPRQALERETLDPGLRARARDGPALEGQSNRLGHVSGFHRNECLHAESHCGRAADPPRLEQTSDTCRLMRRTSHTHR